MGLTGRRDSHVRVLAYNEISFALTGMSFREQPFLCEKSGVVGKSFF